jgi:hypothetical protein
MHDSVMNWVQRHIGPGEVAGKPVAEVGSRDHNGSVQEIICFLEPASYLGIDIQPGPKVNLIMDAADLPCYGSFDLVVSTECLDHCEDWKSAVRGMVTALNPGGLWLLTVRSEGFAYHRYPEDYWRFSIEDVSVIAARTGMEILVLDSDPACQGVFLKARKPSEWTPDWIDLDDVTVPEVVKD